MSKPKGWERSKRDENDDRYDFIRYWKKSNPKRGQYTHRVFVKGPDRIEYGRRNDEGWKYAVISRFTPDDEITREGFSNKDDAISRAYEIVQNNPDGLSRTVVRSTGRRGKPRGKTPDRLKGRRPRDR